MSNEKQGTNNESAPLNLRVPHALLARLTALSARIPAIRRHRLAVEALAYGLAALEADPTLLLRAPGEVPPAPPPPAPRVVEGTAVVVAPRPRSLKARLAAARKAGVTIDQLAEGAGVSHGTAHAAVSGRNVREETAAGLARALDALGY
jgi:hypothetical protein